MKSVDLGMEISIMLYQGYLRDTVGSIRLPHQSWGRLTVSSFSSREGLSLGTQFFQESNTMAFLWSQMLCLLLAASVEGATEFGRIRSTMKEHALSTGAGMYRPSIPIHQANLDLQRVLDGYVWRDDLCLFDTDPLLTVKVTQV